MHVWKFGCGITLLGVALTLGSCGLFSMAFTRQLEQRQIVTRNVDFRGSPSHVDFVLDEPSRVRVDFAISVEPSSDDYAAADSSATIETARLAIAYHVTNATGRVLSRGAGDATGSEIIPEAARRDRSGFGESIDLNYQGDAFDVEEAGQLELEVTVPPEDDEGREVLAARAIIHDRVGKNAGGLAAGGLLSLLAGPVVFGAGLIVFLIGLFTRSRAQSPPPA